jgi:WD40 repeat protein
MPDNQPLLGAAAFSPDSRILAVVCDQFSVQLIDLKGFHSLGLLQAPGQLALHALQFSPDGTQLAATGVAGRLRLWDLRQLRRRLHELGLDRDWPASDVR